MFDVPLQLFFLQELHVLTTRLGGSIHESGSAATSALFKRRRRNHKHYNIRLLKSQQKEESDKRKEKCAYENGKLVNIRQNEGLKLLMHMHK